MLADASTLEALRQSVAEDSLHEFMRQAWPVIEPGKAFQDNWHLRVICEQLERVTRREIRRLIINVPPRSTKSTIVSVLWPVWTWLQDPSHQWLTVSHAADLAIRDALKSRRLMQSPWFQARWGRLVRLTGDQNQKSRYENDRRGYRIAMSMGAGITGEGADCVARGTLVATEVGDMPVEMLHAMPAPPRVWSRSSDGRLELQPIQASRVIRARKTITLCTLAGDKLQCTNDHRIYSSGAYRPAKDFTGNGLPVLRLADLEQARARDSVHGLQKRHSDLRAMLESVQARCGRTCEALEAQPDREAILRPCVLRTRATQNENVSAMRQGVSLEGSGRADVLEGMLRGFRGGDEDAQTPARQAMSRVWRDDGRAQQAPQLLHAEMQEQGALEAYGRARQLTLRGGHESGWFVLEASPDDSGARWHDMRGVWGGSREAFASGASCRRKPIEQRPDESDYAVRTLPRASPRIQESTAAIVPLETGCAGDEVVDVYDIQVARNRNFFAGGILVHNCIVIDDPHDRNAAHSELERTTGLTTFDESLSTRLNDPATGAIVVIMQRLHVNDLTGHLLSGQEPWVHLCLPMEFEPDVRCPLDQRTVPGEPLWPARFTPAVVAALKARLGPYGAAGQLQQRPSPRGGGVWPIEKFQTYKSDPGPMEQYVQSWDFAFKKTEDGSYVVGQVWGKRGAGFYLLDQMRFRGGFNAMCGAVLQLSAKWPAALTKLVEPKANGEAVLDSLRQHVAGLVPVEVEGSKEARAEAVSPAIYAGNVFIPDKAIAPWVTEFVGEVEAFPNGAHDDQVDAASQALKHLTGSGHGMFDAAQFAAAFLSD